jgi:MscS family membrane protein
VGQMLSFVYERRLKKKTEATNTEIDDIVIRSLGGPIALVGVAVAAVGRNVLSPTETAQQILTAVVEILLIISFAWIGIQLTDGLIKIYSGRYTKRTESKLDDALVPIVSWMTNIPLISISIIVILDSI